MSDLWMILVLLGVSIVLAVVVFNWWQEKKYRRDVEYRFSHTRGDVLDTESSSKEKESFKRNPTEKQPVSEEVEGWMSEPRVRQSPKVEPDFTVSRAVSSKKPVSDKSGLNLNKQPGQTPTPSVDQFGSGMQPVAEIPSPVTQQSTPDVAELPEEKESEPLFAPEVVIETPALPSAVHTAMDWVGLIDAPLGVMLAELEDMQAEVRTFSQHATLWVQSSISGDWHDVLNLDANAMQEQTPASQVVCSLQLADRGGPVDEETLKRFQKSMETLARALGLTVSWQGGYEPSQQAQSIDAFCIEVDKAVEFHVLANQGMFHATKLRGLAEACGMQLSDEGRFELFNTQGQLEFSVRNYEGKPFSADMLKSAVMTGMTFQLDIPTTPNSLQVFDHMVEIAQNMAGSLNASLIDVNRKPIADVQLDKIRQQLRNISNAMAAQGIIPGSSHAKRLFS
jgi:FtsZ-interacting cell division protein ZipA